MEQTKYDVFISYSREDKEKVFPFVERINKALGIECWIDLEGIESGEQFENVIIKAIDECKVVLFMLSDSSLKSEWTKREVYYAEGEGKRIVPVLVKGEKLRGWFKFHFGNVDFIDIRSEEQKEKLIRDLRKWLEKKNVFNSISNIGNKFDASNINTHAYRFAEGLYVIKDQAGKWGYIDNKGKIALICKWEMAHDFSEGLASDRASNWKWGFINKTGKEVILCQWKDACNFDEGLARVQNDQDKWGFINRSDKVICPCQWDAAESFSEGMAAVMNGRGLWGFINKNGKLAIQCKWASVTNYYGDGTAYVYDNQNNSFIIDKAGRRVDNEPYDY